MNRSIRGTGSIVASAALASMLSFMAPAARAAPVDFAGNVALTSDYVWRGSTQNRGDPALQGGARLSAASGWYASAWASNVRFAPGAGANAERDFGVGWSGRTGRDWVVDAGLVQYRYPSAADLDWTEFDATATWKERYWLTFGWSENALASGSAGAYVLLGAKFPVSDRFRLEAGLGAYALGGAGEVRRADGYAHVFGSAIWTLSPSSHGPLIEARLTAHATDSRAERLFGADTAGDRIEAALQLSF